MIGSCQYASELYAYILKNHAYILKMRFFTSHILLYREPLESDSRPAVVTIDVQHPDLLSTNPSNFSIIPGDSKTDWIIYVKGLSAGHLIVSANVTPSNITE